MPKPKKLCRRDIVAGPGMIRAFAILCQCHDAGEPTGVRDLARRTGVYENSMTDIVKRLKKIGWVHPTEPGSHGQLRPAARLFVLLPEINRRKKRKRKPAAP